MRARWTSPVRWPTPFDVPLHAATTTRLLVDLNRSIGHRQLFSEVTRALPPARRRDIVDRHYRPHRQAVEAEVERLVTSGQRVVHVALAQFHADARRRADGARTSRGCMTHADQAKWPSRGAWMRELARRAPDLRLRRNYPYRGRGDGLTAALRRRYPDAAYVGIELEFNQSFVGAARDLGQAEGASRRLAEEGARRRVGSLSTALRR